jgi:hypothetical protein
LVGVQAVAELEIWHHCLVVQDLMMSRQERHLLLECDTIDMSCGLPRVSINHIAREGLKSDVCLGNVMEKEKQTVSFTIFNQMEINFEEHIYFVPSLYLSSTLLVYLGNRPNLHIYHWPGGR